MAQTVASSSDSPPGTRRIRVAVADDHAVFRDALCRLLSLEPDIEVVACATNGAEALEAVRNYAPDILLLDLQMPEIDGMETLRRLRSTRTRTRVVLLTACEERDAYVEAVRYGTAGVVSKQSAGEILVKSIRKVYEGQVWLDSETTSAVLRQFRNPDRGPQANPTGAQPAPPLQKAAHALTPREREVVLLLIQGLRNRDIAERMFLSEQTIKNHLNNIFAKLDVTDRLELALYAIHHGLHST
jgi:DNA-binding NarL/FixJ family response regulator